jgi:GMP synthase (glutamine-hydrolysing)
MNKDTILILDFGSQYTQLIARRVRELKVYSIIAPCTISLEEIKKIGPKAIILSGGPHSVYQEKAPTVNPGIFKSGLPILGICYGKQLLTKLLGGKVVAGAKREYGKAVMYIDNHQDLFFTLPAKITSWMSHGDKAKILPKGFIPLAHTDNTDYAAIADVKRKIYGVQFHPEVVHTEFGTQVISNFLFRIAECNANWQLDDFITSQVMEIRKQVGEKGKVLLGLSGGVDSSVAAVLLHKAIGSRLTCIFVNNGLLRADEADYVQKVFRGSFHINLKYVDASKSFLKKLQGVVDPEQKRKIIGHEFINVFEKAAKAVKGVGFLGQGTLYPDVIESIPFFGGPTAKIKSHHNVGGLPEKMKLKLVEPFRELFKDEVREIGKKLNVPEQIITRQPFPGPGLAVRIIGEITPERIKILQDADSKVEKIIRKHGLYEKIWQSFAVLLPLKTVGVMGDSRTYDNVIALRSVDSVDGMTADWTRLPYDVMEEISNTIINEVRGVNRVVFDISSKPPATIEWE